MDDISGPIDIQQFIEAALECSIHFSPGAPGLSVPEIYECGRRAGLKDGEIGDVVLKLHEYGEDNRLLPSSVTLATATTFAWKEEPELRNIDAFDFVYGEMLTQMREVGVGAARLDRAPLVEQGAAAGIPRDAIEAAVTMLVLVGHFKAKGDTLSPGPITGHFALPSDQRKSARGLGFPMKKKWRAEAIPIVKDVLARRSDGRPAHVEALDEFAGALDGLGYGRFRVWWVQTVSELRQAQSSSAPTSMCVLSAALVEGALTFVVAHARRSNLAVFRSPTFNGSPRTWKIDELVKSATTGGPDAILNAATRAQADALVRIRQRIHAGRLLEDYPHQLPDLRPEEARHAKATAEAVVRCVTDWLRKYPPGEADS